MPRKPGTKSTRKTVPSTEGLEVSSFIMSHEQWLWRKPCVIEGCDHRMGPKTDEPCWVNWKSCDEDQLPAFVVRADPEDHAYENVGIACPCHVTEVLGQFELE